ncbi:unnamed protein product [Closterium sp. Yama58-4]|nr:unnamed protein product [Closterium sp. Yama58-4]
MLSLFAIVLALLLAPAAAGRPTKEEVIAEVKNVRVTLDDPELSSQYRASAVFLDTLIPQLETNWNPTDDFLASTEGKTILLPDDNAIASAAPGALADLMNPSLPRQKVRSYVSMIRANMLNGVYDEDGIKKAKVLTDGNASPPSQGKRSQYAALKLLLTTNGKTWLHRPAPFAQSEVLTERSDAFSFGVVLLQLATGQPPVMQGVPLSQVVLHLAFGPHGLSAAVDPKLSELFHF